MTEIRFNTANLLPADDLKEEELDAHRFSNIALLLDSDTGWCITHSDSLDTVVELESGWEVDDDGTIYRDWDTIEGMLERDGSGPELAWEYIAQWLCAAFPECQFNRVDMRDECPDHDRAGQSRTCDDPFRQD